MPVRTQESLAISEAVTTGPPYLDLDLDLDLHLIRDLQHPDLKVAQKKPTSNQPDAWRLMLILSTVLYQHNTTSTNHFPLKHTLPPHIPSPHRSLNHKQYNTKTNKNTHNQAQHSSHKMATLLNNLSTSLSTTGKEQVLPALNSLSKAITSFSANQLGPALAGAAIGLDVFGKEKVIPAMLEAGKFGKEKIGPKVLEVGEYVRENAGPAVKKTGEYVKENPGMTAVYAVSGLTILVPGLVSGPALWVFGWGGLGVRGGELDFVSFIIFLLYCSLFVSRAMFGPGFMFEFITMRS